MIRVALPLLLLLASEPIVAQRRVAGRPTRGPARAVPLPGLGAGAPMIRTERLLATPVKNGPIAFPSERRQWVRIETAHYTILSSAGVRTTRRIAQDLERLTSVLTSTSPYFRLPAARTRV